MVKNKYKIPANLWKKLNGDPAKKMYIAVMDQMLPNQDLTTHPRTPKISHAQWTTICHNAACYAAWALTGEELVKGEIVESVNMKTGKVIKMSKAN